MAEEYSLNLGSEFRDLDERLKGDSTSLHKDSARLSYSKTHLHGREFNECA